MQENTWCKSLFAQKIELKWIRIVQVGFKMRHISIQHFFFIIFLYFILILFWFYFFTICNYPVRRYLLYKTQLYFWTFFQRNERSPHSPPQKKTNCFSIQFQFTYTDFSNIVFLQYRRHLYFHSVFKKCFFKKCLARIWMRVYERVFRRIFYS